MEKKIPIEVLHKELDLIQDVVSRMANNSFLSKGWLITILGVILAFTKDSIIPEDAMIVQDSSMYVFILLLFPTFMFWYLDAYFLRQERFYRHLYNWVIINREQENTTYLYALNPQIRFQDKKNVKTIWDSIFSETLLVFYTLPTIICLSGIVNVLTKSYISFVIGLGVYFLILIIMSFDKKS